MTEFRDIRSDLSKLTQSKFIVKYGLLEKATQVLLKLIAASTKEPQKFLTLAEVRRNFKRITTDEVFAITGELEKLRLVETSINKTRLVVRLNIFGLETNGFDQVRQDQLKRYITDRELKRVENARRVLKEFEKREQTISNSSSVSKTALELHEAKECDKEICRFCALEQDKAIGF